MLKEVHLSWFIFGADVNLTAANDSASDPCLRFRIKWASSTVIFVSRVSLSVALPPAAEASSNPAGRCCASARDKITLQLVLGWQVV
jgi:hypothetical protein